MAKKLKAEEPEDYISRPIEKKPGWLWGGGNDDIVGNYSILNQYDKILEPILLSFEIMSLALLSQYQPSVATLPKVIN